jgi:polyisoprenoid-binding protein YceI
MSRNLLVIGLFALLAAPVLAADTYEVDPVHSTVVFKVAHLGVSNVHGRFNEVTGTVALDEAKPALSSIDIQIKVESIDTNSAKRDQHLKSPDFFNAKQFPVIAFKSKEVKKVGEKLYDAKGDLTLHGVTREVTIRFRRIGEGKDPWGGYRSGGEATFTIKRSDFGMKFMLEGVGDEVQISVGLEGIRK